MNIDILLQRVLDYHWNDAVQKCLEIHGLELFVDYRGGFGKHIDSWTAAPVGDQSKKNESVERMISLGTL